MMPRPTFPAAAALVLIGTIALIGSCSSEAPPEPASTGQVGFVPDRKPPPPIRWRDATIEAGTEFALTLNGAVGSATSRAGDPFQARMARAYIEGDRVVIPEGSIIHGVIGEVTAASRAVGNQGGMLVLSFVRITTPTGAAAAIEASVSEISGGGAVASLPDKKVIIGGARKRDVDLKEGTPLTVVLNGPLAIKVRI